MQDKEFDKALDIVSILLNGGEISKKENIILYEEYENNTEVFDMVRKVFKKMNINLYEYNYGLYISAGENNKVFGYSNEELKKEMGIKLNRELYLCYFIIYIIITRFYKDSSNYTFVEYIKLEDVVCAMDNALKSITEIALTWEDMPIIGQGETTRASRGSKSGFVKLTLNFLVNQELLIEEDSRYYPRDRFKALIENYFDEYKGRIYEILKGEE